MSQYPDPAPYGAYGAYGGAPAPPPRRPRPSPAWFALGGVLLAVSVALVIPAIVLSIAAFTQVEARVAADGVTRTVPLEPGRSYLLWSRPEEAVQCRLVDADSGDELALRGLGSASYSRDLGDGEWVGAGTFATRSAGVEVTCAPGSSAVEIGEKPRVHTVIGGVLLGLVLPIVLGILGVVVLVVVSVLYAVRPPRGATPGR